MAKKSTSKKAKGRPAVRSTDGLEEHHEAFVRRVQWAPGDTYQQVCVQTFKFPDNSRVEVVVRLPSGRRKLLYRRG